MSYHTRPDCRVPDQEQRCQALVKGYKPFRWAMVDHQCVRPAQQGRDNIQVCANHARSKTLIPWKGYGQ